MASAGVRRANAILGLPGAYRDPAPSASSSDTRLLLCVLPLRRRVLLSGEVNQQPRGMLGQHPG